MNIYKTASNTILEVFVNLFNIILQTVLVLKYPLSSFVVHVLTTLFLLQLYDKVRRSEQKYRVALEVLSYHSQCTEQELNALKAEPIPDNIPSITE